MRLLFKTAALLILAAFQCSCATRQYELDLSEYPKLPGAKIVHSTRTLIERSEKLSHLALWGNYGGPGCVGGKPIDSMDECFRRHDLSYLQGVKRRQLIEADRLLISHLESLDPDNLTPEADVYRRRAIRYFERPISRIIGKPPNVLFGLKTRPMVIDTSAAK